MPTETAKPRVSERPGEKCGISSTLETNTEVRPIPMGYGEEIEFLTWANAILITSKWIVIISDLTNNHRLIYLWSNYRD